MTYITHCHKPLARFGKSFALIQDPLNNVQRVHKQCLPQAVGDGYTEVKNDKLDQQIAEAKEKHRVMKAAGLHTSARVLAARIESLTHLKENP